MLLGDSTVIGNVLRFVKPDGPHLEKVTKAELVAEPDMPDLEVLNLGVGGDYIRQFLASGRYDTTVARQPRVRFILLRFGLNDYFRLPAFTIDFLADYERLIERLRADHPQATLVMMTVIPYHSPSVTASINSTIQRIARAQGLPLLDTHAPYEAALRDDPHRLSYRSIPMNAVPVDDLPAIARHVYRIGSADQVVVVDDEFDQRFGHLPSWHSDRHPNFEGYRLIGKVSGHFLVDCIRASRRPQNRQGHVPESRPLSP